MFIWISCKQVFIQMRQNKLRSILALFGVMWGTLAVLLLLAFGQAFANASQQRIQSLASGLLVSHSGASSMPFRGIPQGQPIIIHAQDVVDFAAQETAADISPMLGGKVTDPMATLNYKRRHSLGVNILGIGPNFASITQLQLSPGSHFISQHDLEKKQRVIIISQQIRKTLFAKQRALNKVILVSGIPFRVIGVLKSDHQQFYEGGWSLNTHSYIPYSTYIQIWGDAVVNHIYLLPKDVNQIAALIARTRNHFALLKHFSPNDKPAFDIPSQLQQIRHAQREMSTIRLFLACCGLMTLAVGGVSIANMMFLTVTERRREIGLYMALGAKSHLIKLQVLIEACIIVLLGGLCGLLIALAIIAGINAIGLPSWLGQPHIGLRDFIMICAILLGISLAAGFFPARRAANLAPVTALGF